LKNYWVQNEHLLENKSVELKAEGDRENNDGRVGGSLKKMKQSRKRPSCHRVERRAGFYRGKKAGTSLEEKATGLLRNDQRRGRKKRGRYRRGG